MFLVKSGTGLDFYPSDSFCEKTQIPHVCCILAKIHHHEFVGKQSLVLLGRLRRVVVSFEICIVEIRWAR